MELDFEKIDLVYKQLRELHAKKLLATTEEECDRLEKEIEELHRSTGVVEEMPSEEEEELAILRAENPGKDYVMIDGQPHEILGVATGSAYNPNLIPPKPSADNPES